MATAATAKYVIRLEDKTKRAFKAIGRSMKKVTKAVFSLKAGFISAAGIAGIGFLIKRSMNATDEMAKMSRAIGVSVEELQALRHAAALGGLQSTQLDKAVQKLAINMADMSRGVGLAKDVFEKHNISVTKTDGSLRSVIDVMNDVADVTAGMTNATEKADLAYKLFGARGAKMINMLNGGSEAMQAAMAEAKELGLVMSGETAKGVEDANDSITRLSSFLTSSFTVAVAKLAPAIEAVTIQIMKWVTAKVKDGGGIGEIARTMANAIIDASIAILLALENTGNGILQFVNELKEKLGLTQRPMQDVINDLNRVQGEFQNFLNGEFSGFDKVQISLTSVAKTTEYYKDELELLHKEMSQVQAVGENLYKIELSGLRNTLAATKELVTATGNLVPAIDAVTAASEEAADPTVWDQMKNGFESYFTSVKKGTISIASITEGVMKTAEDAIVNMMMGVKTNWKSLFKAILADIIRLQIRKAMVSAMTGIFGFANGGRPPSNRPSIVGEKGAELFVPDSAGTIVPNDQLGGGGNTTAEINFNVQAIDASSFNSFLVNNRDTIESIINNSITTNGSVRRTIQMAG